MTDPTTDTDRPTLGTITRHAGIAGQYAYAVKVTYPGEAGTVVTFTGDVYGGPIVMEWPGFSGIFVSTDVLDRIGRKLSPAWIRAFYGV